jgi:hypothetical protein
LYKFRIEEISKEQALTMIQKYHYSNTLPKLNKYFVGFFLGDEMVGVVTLGWGTRPRHTIQRIFPSLDTQDYLEIGRMCMTEDMPRNSESQMLSQLVKWLKANHPGLKVLFTWADGMVGKVGYVYQASNFIYAGYSGGEMYMKDGVKIHVRQMKSFLIPEGTKDDRITVRPTFEQMKQFNILHFKGKQYRYLLFLCGKKEEKRLLKECLIDLSLPRPKDDDLSWTIRDMETGKWVESTKPPYVTDVDQKTKHLVNLKKEELIKCDSCDCEMLSGYVIRNGEEHFCSDDCLHGWYSEDEYDELCQTNEAYWSEWLGNYGYQTRSAWLDNLLEDRP